MSLGRQCYDFLIKSIGKFISDLKSIVNLSQVVPNLCLVRSIWGFLRLRSRGLIFVWGTHPVKLFVT